MREILGIAVLCLLSSCALLNEPAPTPAEPAPAPAPIIDENPLHLRKKILLLPFLDHSERGQEAVARNVLEQVRTQLAAMSDVVVIQPADLPDATLVPELGTYNWKKIFAIGRSEGIAGVITGTVDTMENTEVGGETEVGLFKTQQFTTEVKLTVEIYDVAARRRQFARTETGDVTEERTQILESSNPEAQEKERQLQAASRALQKVFANLPNQLTRIAWSGHIAKIDLHRIYINGGRATGLMPGQLLRVISEGEPVFDSVSGRPLGIPSGRVKGMVRIVENFGPDASIAVVHSGAGFREQDRVEPFNPPASDR